jgi:uncharacterized membrane protein YhaH (DUF805 family)
MTAAWDNSQSPRALLYVMSPEIARPAPIDLEEPMSPLHIVFGLSGRVPRKVFWFYGVLLPLALGAYLHALAGIARLETLWFEGVLNGVLLWSALAVSAKRWHDRDRSGWWALVQFIPVIGWLWILVANGLLRGTPGRNRFGDDLSRDL